MRESDNCLSLRRVATVDQDLIFDWVNDPEVRFWSFSKKKISVSEHQTWFKKKYSDPNVLMWIFQNDNSPAGLVRFEKKDGEVFLHYLIAPGFRRRGLARKMLRLAINEVMAYWPGVKVLAYTLPENIVSIRSLEGAGFSLEKSSDRTYWVYSSAHSTGLARQ
jgi:RimJ/RimL family protein N-acetyltransferase